MTNGHPNPVTGESFQGVPAPGYVELRDYVERIFEEKDKSAEFARGALEKALVEARVTTDRAITEARETVSRAQVEAKMAADAVTSVVFKRLDNLESGGAPFASRLDESLVELKRAVEVLKENMVKTTVLDALREQGAVSLRQQRRQILYIAITAGTSLAVAVFQAFIK